MKKGGYLFLASVFSTILGYYWMINSGGCANFGMILCLLSIDVAFVSGIVCLILVIINYLHRRIKKYRSPA